jgi:tetratricopeptide (TPR) repeat protein
VAADQPPFAEPAPPSPVDEGLRHHRAGGLDRAEALYRAALADQPDNADALHLLGVLRHQQGSAAEAIELIGRAIALNPAYAGAHNSLGFVLWDLGRPADAAAHYREAVRLAPGFADAHCNLGAALSRLGHPAEAVASYREALRLRPDYPEAHNNLASALCDLGRPAEAVTSCREALRLRPDYADAHSNLGNALRALGRPVEAMASYRTALRLRPNQPEAHCNLSNALRDVGRTAEAAASCREALRLRPNYPEAYLNLGNALRELGRTAEAAASYREALRLRPDYPDAQNNLGAVAWDLGQAADAEASYRAALRLRPGFAEAHSNLANVLLLTGRLAEGWEENEWRWQARHLAADTRRFAAPLWNGEPIGDRVILLHAEQGLGDTLQFCRYVPLVGAGARVVLEVQAPLVRLLLRLPGVAKLVTRGDRLPPFDLHCPLLSLPRALGTTLDTIPGTTPYLAADAALAAKWRERLAGLAGLRVGLVWAGGRRPDPNLAIVDRRRSIALDRLAPLGAVPGVSLVSLQKGPASRVDPPPDLALHDFTAELQDFADTAALVDGLDLVISVDTAVVHLAGALGKPVWLLNRFDTCWRWLLGRDDSPWYPQLRQFRQPTPGDWDSVIREVRDSLQLLAAGGREPLQPR